MSRSAGGTKLDQLISKIQRNTQRDRRAALALASASAELASSVLNSSDAPLLTPSPPLLTPLLLTHVAFYEGDTLGHLAALVTITPLAAIVALAAWVVARRELRALSMLVGCLATAGVCVLLKRQFQQSRPTGALLPDYGMPSNHAQVASYLVANGLAFLWQDVTMSAHAWLWKSLLSAAAVIWLVAVAASRVYLGEHSRGQVDMGLCVGSAIGLIWHLAYRSALPSLRPLVQQNLLCRYFLVRETSRVRDVLGTEFDMYDALGRGEDGKRSA